ncbi:pyridoxamine 5'-phosphate oxidase family protein [Actinomadura verrucosospora]|uniref:Pyridoxamine 5'-phosphate oxidase-like protein n=1 Tax=Actinomadura verrucosospora TaxID=46165 RepID=A0A7D3W1U7_ACTVE|nr:pyridoxamine 5'-phosphate oxidase family protein [Actinomadura verrucosospora]QKG27118.1 pyridoxamine 5'-phosphate oxidase-like protein [Actinomadura verrucosospora]
MEFDRSGLEVLGPRECRALLRHAEVGRIVFTHNALPAVQPVNYVVDGEDIVFRTSGSSRLATAATGAIVAFEIDDFDTEARTGWSVVAVGPARRVSAPGEITALEKADLRTWAQGQRDQFIRIRPEMLSGRRIRHGPDGIPEERSVRGRCRA